MSPVFLDLSLCTRLASVISLSCTIAHSICHNGRSKTGHRFTPVRRVLPVASSPQRNQTHVLRHLLPEVRYDAATSCLAEDSNEQFRSVASLLRVDRETFNTLAPTAYSQRTIVFRNPTLSADQLLRHCSTVCRANLRYLILHLHSDEPVPMLRRPDGQDVQCALSIHGATKHPLVLHNQVQACLRL